MSEGEGGFRTPEGFVTRPDEPARLGGPPIRVPLSLFEGDVVNRLFGALGLHGRRAVDLIGRSAVLVAVTWGGVALCALASGVAHGPAGENFFKDFAAYLQLVVGLPLFVIAEKVIGEHTREAGGYFVTAGVIPAADIATVEAVHRRVERLRVSPVSDVVCLAAAVALALSTILPQLSATCASWHTETVAHVDALKSDCDELKKSRLEKEGAEKGLRTAAEELKEAAKALKAAGMTGARTEEAAKSRPAESRKEVSSSEAKAGDKILSAAGWWEMLVALPVLNFWWLRWIWKIGLWSWYLFRLSRVPMTLIATHPDATGGIGFISDVQTKFGLAILAYGVSNVASTVGYKIGVEQAAWSLPPVWGPLVGYVVGAPLLFTLPLFMFTKQLYRVKKRAREELYERLGARSRAFEAIWRDAQPSANINQSLLEWHQLRALYSHVEEMRIVPFDLRSFVELMGQTLGALVPLLGYLNLPEPVLRLLEGGSRVLHGGG